MVRIIGFLVCAIGFGIIGFQGSRELGAAIFFAGFILVVAGIVSGTLSLPAAQSLKGTKMASIGFVLFTIGLVIEFFSVGGLSKLFIYAGLLLTGSGIVWGALEIKSGD